MDELLEQFLIEGRELVEQVSEDLLALEADPRNAALIDSAFRGFHTLKGSAALFDFAPLSTLLHAGEDVLDGLRAGARALDAPSLETLLQCVTQTEQWLDSIALEGALPGDAAARSAALKARLAPDGFGAEAVTGHGAAEAAGWAEAMLAGQTIRGLPPGVRRLTAVRYTPRPDSYFSGDDPLAVAAGVPQILALEIAPREPWEPRPAYDPFRCNLVLRVLSSAPAAAVAEAFRFVSDQVELAELDPPPPRSGDEPADLGRAPPAFPRGDRGRTLRVDAERLDALAATVDELVIAKNELAHLTRMAAELSDAEALTRGLSGAQAGLERLLAGLHGAVMRLRLVRLSGLFRRFPRLVRDTAASLGKDVTLTLRGEEVEVDKAVADRLFEPLLHLLRNAVDHGVESAEDRRAAGKRPRATLSLSADTVGDSVVIEVADDGGGVDAERIRRVAVDRGLLSREAAAALDDQAATELIFAPGFSTAAAVTDISGRGVGLDAVRAAVLGLGGRLAIRSRKGAGATVRLTLPATVLLTPIMVVEAGGERLGVPLSTVAEATRVARDRVVPIRDGRAFVFRDRPVPLFSLSGLLGLAGGTGGEGDLLVLVVRLGDELAAVSVDAMVDRMEVPLRPMTGLLSGFPGVVGSTLTGEGRVLMVVDVAELIG